MTRKKTEGNNILNAKKQAMVLLASLSGKLIQNMNNAERTKLTTAICLLIGIGTEDGIIK